jgi:hypothetical protein
MLNSVLNGRKRAFIISVVVISVTLLLLASWHSGAFEDAVLQAHAEAASGYVKQWFNKKPESVPEEAVPKYIATDAVRIYIGIVQALIVRN